MPTGEAAVASNVGEDHDGSEISRAIAQAAADNLPYVVQLASAVEAALVLRDARQLRELYSASVDQRELDDLQNCCYAALDTAFTHEKLKGLSEVFDRAKVEVHDAAPSGNLLGLLISQVPGFNFLAAKTP